MGFYQRMRDVDICGFHSSDHECTRCVLVFCEGEGHLGVVCKGLLKKKQLMVEYFKGLFDW